MKDIKMSRYKRSLLSLFMVLILLIGCSSGNDRDKNTDHFETGKVIPKVVCKKDINISYALYLPSRYSRENKYPVIFAFDAHAKGIKPVELFSEMAEKYGYIIVGSNNSQNGMQSEESMRIYEVLSDDILTRFSVDNQRVYTAGFSGGSRVASSIAIFKGGISGVIGCSAGFPSLTQPIQFKFDYIGFVGDEDMNYLEMCTLEDALKQSGYRHQLIVFKGIHDWPAKDVIKDAFIWTEANAMKDKKKPADSSFISENLGSWKAAVNELRKQGKKYDAYVMLKKIANFFGGLSDITEINKQLTALESYPEVKNMISRSKDNQSKELNLQTQYIKALGEKNINWWQQEIKRLNDFASTTKEDDERAITKRVLGYLSLVAYSNSTGYLNMGQLDKASHFITLYSIIDPSNNEHAYLSAVLSVKMSNPEKAFESLQNALSLGFNDLNRYQGDTVLARLKNDTRYFDILEKLRQGN